MVLALLHGLRRLRLGSIEVLEELDRTGRA